MADARDLKSLIPKGMCGFESRRRQRAVNRRLNSLQTLRRNMSYISGWGARWLATQQASAERFRTILQYLQSKSTSEDVSPAVLEKSPVHSRFSRHCLPKQTDRSSLRAAGGWAFVSRQPISKRHRSPDKSLLTPILFI